MDSILFNLKVILSSTILLDLLQTSRLRAYSRTAYYDLIAIAKITAPTRASLNRVPSLPSRLIKQIKQECTT
uniref:Uncharacterized protein n=1 Tax=Utricularia reniformis TaxID=192314 RepID=A0A1Y0B1T6_9LAMI|nr:hypothetical protein AEK19_MT1201 [Utricularia reniformis]ART31415.1 hypothetical protein AEK19_MT1201 [Utricularia reniformis]